MSLTVRYHNDLNKFPMRNWKADEMNMFFAIIAKMKNEGSREMTFDSEEIKDIINFKRREKERWFKVMDGVSDKLTDLKYVYDDEYLNRKMPLFAYFDIYKKEQKVVVALNEHFEYILNDFEKEFTYYKFDEFVEIKSTYAKTAYRLFKQWKKRGEKKWDIETFKKEFSIPKSYGTSNIDKRVVEPIIEELSPYFEDLKFEKKQAKTRGNPVKGYEFYWKPEKTGKWVETEENAVIKKDVPIYDWT